MSKKEFFSIKEGVLNTDPNLGPEYVICSNKRQLKFATRYHLSTEPYSFIFTFNFYDDKQIRARLLDGQDNIVDELNCTHLNQTQVINHFEARLFLRQVPSPTLTEMYTKKLDRGIKVIIDKFPLKEN